MVDLLNSYMLLSWESMNTRNSGRVDGRHIECFAIEALSVVQTGLRKTSDWQGYK